MTDDEWFKIFAIVSSCLWVVLCIWILVYRYKIGDKEGFGRWLMALLVTPVAVGFMMVALVLGFLWMLTDGIPSLIFKLKKDKP